MKIGIFQEPAGGMGGSELVTAVMADALRDRHEVEIVHHRPDLSIERLEQFFDLKLAGVRSRFVAPPIGGPLYGRRYLHLARRYWRERDADVSAPYDLFIANVHGIPPHCHARQGVLHVLFPGFVKPKSWPWGQSARNRLNRILDPLRRPIYEAGWRERMGTYQTRLAISQYSALWTKEYWDVSSEVLYPPVFMDPIGGPKADAILSLARFSPEKQQGDLLKTFADRVAPRAPGWELVFVGGLSDRPEDHAYFTELQKAAEGLPVRFVANASRGQVRAELSGAKIYWHAMGLGVDPDREPHKIEHFGIAPVEAMANGCVPVVFDRGGPAEVVRDRQCGYTCSSLEQMAERIVGLIEDESSRGMLSSSARIRAMDFSADRFKERFLMHLHPILEPAARGVA